MFGGEIQAQAHREFQWNLHWIPVRVGQLNCDNWGSVTASDDSREVKTRLSEGVLLTAGAWSCTFPFARTDTCMAEFPAWLVCTHQPSFPWSGGRGPASAQPSSASLG